MEGERLPAGGPGCLQLCCTHALSVLLSSCLQVQFSRANVAWSPGLQDMPVSCQQLHRHCGQLIQHFRFQLSACRPGPEGLLLVSHHLSFPPLPLLPVI